MRGDPGGYRQHVLHVEPDGTFSIVALVWLPGQETPIYDHVSWCVPGVYRGQEEETRFGLVVPGLCDVDRDVTSVEDEPYLVGKDIEINQVGEVVALSPPGDIHKVRNPGPGAAVSIHVYGADIGVLGSSIRWKYNFPVRKVT